MEHLLNCGKHHIVGRGRLGRTVENGLIQIGRSVVQDVEQADIVWFCVPESRIAEVCGGLSENMKSETVRLHTSGFLPADILDTGGDCVVGTLHPAYSFHVSLNQMPTGIFWTYEGSAELIPAIQDLVTEWKGTLHLLKREDKCAYHVICVLLANLTAVPALTAKNLSDRIGLPFSHLLSSLLLPVLNRLAASVPGDDGLLTGPAVRGDMKTVQAQLDWLAAHHPVGADIYRVLSDAIRQLSDGTLPSDPQAGDPV